MRQLLLLLRVVHDWDVQRLGHRYQFLQQSFVTILCRHMHLFVFRESQIPVEYPFAYGRTYDPHLTRSRTHGLAFHTCLDENVFHRVKWHWLSDPESEEPYVLAIK